MKIALCITGQPRFFERGYEYINKYIITPNNITDIFCHFWFDKDDIGKVGYGNTSRTLPKENYNNDTIKHYTPDLVKKLYNPKKISHEKQYDCNKFIKRDYSSRSNLTNPFATFSQYLSTHKCITLKSEYEKENKFEYDIVIKCRYDFINDRNINIKNTSSIVFHNDVHNNNKIIVNDGFYYGNNKLMTEMLMVAYLNFDYYWLNYDILWDNHDLLGKYLELNGIPFEKTNLGNIKWIRN